MPDISLCDNESCSQKEKCFRFMAKPDPVWQSYANFGILCNEENNYKMFIKIKPKDILKKE